MSTTHFEYAEPRDRDPDMEVLGYSLVVAAPAPPAAITDMTVSARRLSDTSDEPAVFWRPDEKCCRTFLSHGLAADDVCFQK